ncbi:MAG: GNAT family N-acetyltransferase, partial [Alphaproteobacteria bacterium]
GGYRGEDSLFAFKARFSPLRAEFHIGRAVHDEAVMRELTETAQTAGKAEKDTAFFPPYRSGR